MTASVTEPSFVTPNPGIHSTPGTGASATPESALGVINQATGISTGVAGQVSTALTGASGAGSPFAALASFGQAALGAVENVAQLFIQLGVDAVEGVVSIIQDVVQGVADIIGAIINAFTGGGFGSGGTAAQALGAMTATQATIQATASLVQSMQSQDAADSNNGVAFWADYSTGSLTGFTQGAVSGSGTLAVSNGNVVLQPVGSGTVNVQGIYAGTPTSTDDQLVTAIYSVAPTYASGGIVDILICRSNAGMTTYVFAVFGWFGCALYNVVSGVVTLLDSLTYVDPAFYAGGSYSLQAGFDGSSHPTFTPIVNGEGMFEFVDTAGVTNYGALYRCCGFGLEQLSGVAPSQIADFGFVDNAPGPLIGDIFEVQSTTLTQTALANNIDCTLFANNFFDNVGLQSSNYTWSPASANTLTVTKSGTYLVKVAVQWIPNQSAAYALFGVGVFKNGVVDDFDTDAIASPGALPFFLVKSQTFIVQLDAGDSIQPGVITYSNSTSLKNTIVGNFDTAFTCALLNTGQAA